MPIDINKLTTGVTLPKEVSAEILGKVSYASAVMGAAKEIPLPGSGITVPVITGNASASWVGETDNIGVSRPTFAAKDMTPYKLAVIVPFSREFTRDAGALYDAAIEMLPSALALKFDQTVAGGTAPGSNFDVLTGAITEFADADEFGADIAKTVKAVGVAGGAVTDWIVDPAFHGEFITAVDAQGRSIFNAAQGQSVGNVYGAEVRRVPGTLLTGLNALAGDFANAAVYGVVNEVELRISDQATLTDGATQLNLFQRDMVAVRAVIEVGFRVADQAKFKRLKLAA